MKPSERIGILYAKRMTHIKRKSKDWKFMTDEEKAKVHTENYAFGIVDYLDEQASLGGGK